MSTYRFAALQDFWHRKPVEIKASIDRADNFASNVFGARAMQSALPEDAFEAVKDAIKKGSKIDRKFANSIASAMKQWAVSKGATHYTHWFQPLTGATAEKHDAFLHMQRDGSAIETFGGSQLVQQEPDASSFPHGGLRNTFEARGYTAWDPTSPAFVLGTTLCIPTIFVSYTGSALDNKTPLLRALNALDEAATQVANYFDKSVSKVNATLGWEQEFFLVDTSIARARPDIMQAGRALLGHSPAKGQQLSDHYFGSIPARVISFMRDLEEECIALGVPLKTRHNEVAPSQFELAPVHEEANLAVDHNSLIMDLMDKVAARHHYKVLFHEKPFPGINGSGKHNNWSLETDNGVNLLAPGTTPTKNLQFLAFFINTIKAVYDNEELIRASVASASNDHRLGEDEAPPAIMSVYIGSQLTKVLDELEKVTDGKLSPEEKTELKLNVVGKIPEILLDNTDRNRTSPFAFTGNKFEFRAVGSMANCAKPMTVINAVVAKQLKDFKNEVDFLIENKSMKKDDAIFNVLREYIKASKKIRYEGDGYAENWEKQALRRKLSNNKTTPEALKVQTDKKTIALFEEMEIMTEAEIKARHEIEIEEYTKHVQIESRVLGSMARNHIIPTAIRYQNMLIENVQGLKMIYEKDFKDIAGEQMKLIKDVSEHITAINSGITQMIEERKEANKLNVADRAVAYTEKVKPYFSIIKYHSDKLELLVEDKLWPLPKLREILMH